MIPQRHGIIAACMLAAVIACIIIAFTAPAVYVDTDGTELLTTAQPDRLVIDLGADWAGAEFELKLDVGVFPVPVVANESGVLGMDLGGSSTYTLTLLQPSDTGPEAQQTDEQDPATTVTDQPTATGEPAADPPNNGGSALPLILIILGLLLAAGGLAAMYITKKRRAYYDDYDEGDE